MEMLTEVQMVVELMDEGGPTGDFAEVLFLRVEDYGGNVHWTGPVDEYHPNFFGVTGSLPLKIIATKIGKRSGCVAEYRADYAVEVHDDGPPPG